MTRLRRTETRRTLAPLLAITFVWWAITPGLGGPAVVLAADGDLSRAVRLYSFERYEDALAFVEKTIAEVNLENDALRDAHVLQARCLVQLGRNEEALEAFGQALNIDQTWQPEEGLLTVQEMAILDKVQRDQDTGGSWLTKPVTLIAAGIGLVVGILVMGSDDGGGGTEDVDDALYEPPDPPGSN